MLDKIEMSSDEFNKLSQLKQQETLGLTASHIKLTFLGEGKFNRVYKVHNEQVSLVIKIQKNIPGINDHPKRIVDIYNDLNSLAIQKNLIQKAYPISIFIVENQHKYELLTWACSYIDSDQMILPNRHQKLKISSLLRDDHSRGVIDLSVANNAVLLKANQNSQVDQHNEQEFDFVILDPGLTFKMTSDSVANMQSRQLKKRKIKRSISLASLAIALANHDNWYSTSLRKRQINNINSKSEYYALRQKVEASVSQSNNLGKKIIEAIAQRRDPSQCHPQISGDHSILSDLNNFKYELNTDQQGEYTQKLLSFSDLLKKIDNLNLNNKDIKKQQELTDQFSSLNSSSTNESQLFSGNTSLQNHHISLKKYISFSQLAQKAIELHQYICEVAPPDDSDSDHKKTTTSYSFTPFTFS